MADRAAPAVVTAADLGFARLHLRMGLLALARAELEALAALGSLDDEAMVDLAEARWRTGDLTAAGEAARAHLDGGGHELVAYVVAAEATAAAGRPAEARRLVGRALELSDEPLDDVFAGMPRSVIWPTDSATDVEHAGTLFDVNPPDSVPSAAAGPPRLPASAVPPVPGGPAAVAATAATQPDAPSLWDAKATPPASADTPLPDAQELLAAARGAVASGELDSAAVNLAIVLRSAPVLAPAVLTALGDAPVGVHPVLEIVRGDAYRLVGHETDARRAFAAAAGALREPTAADGGRPAASSPADAADGAGPIDDGGAAEPAAVDEPAGSIEPRESTEPAQSSEPTQEAP